MKLALKTFGWLSLITIIVASICALGSIDWMIHRVAISGLMILSLVLFVAIPFWIAYEKEMSNPRLRGTR